MRNAEEDSHRIEKQLNASGSSLSPQWLADLAGVQMYLGDLLVTKSKFDEAVTYYRKAWDYRNALAAKDPSNIGWQSDLEETDDGIGGVMVLQNKLERCDLIHVQHCSQYVPVIPIVLRKPPGVQVQDDFRVRVEGPRPTLTRRPERLLWAAAD